MDINEKYYEQNADKFIVDTINCNMNDLYHLFEKELTNPKTILDLGFGSGRDSKYFHSKGYDVYAIDPSKAFCEHALKIGIPNVYNIEAQAMNFENKFDGIWACASLLHIPSTQLNSVFKKCYQALKPNGIMYPPEYNHRCLENRHTLRLPVVSLYFGKLLRPFHLPMTKYATIDYLNLESLFARVHPHDHTRSKLQNLDRSFLLMTADILLNSADIFEKG